MLIFVGVVIMSLIAGFFFASITYRNQIKDLMEQNLIETGKKIIQTYQATPAAELKPFMQGVSTITSSRIQIYDSTGQPMIQSRVTSHIDQKRINQVIAGKVIRDLEFRDNHDPLVGLPFEDKGESYALFLFQEVSPLVELIMNTLQIVLIIVLVVGSLLIVLAARYIVKPIVRLTAATKRMAQGQFDIRLASARNDEIGQLTRSFNEMAYDLGNLERMRQEFVANVSHEIQTPLTSISGFIKALKQKAMTEENRFRYLTIIEEESQRLSRLGQNLLQLSYLQQEDHPMKPTVYRLDEQLRKTAIALEPQWAAKQLELDFQLAELTIFADEDQLSQVWINLLSNSIKFTPEYGEIRVTAAADHAVVTVAITDSGTGIPAAEQDEVFKPFYKVDKSRDGSKQGNGLGLSIVKRIVTIHRGEIDVSGGIGEGATFTVQLPLAMEASQ